MITRSDWQPIYTAMTERDRGHPDEPPTAEEMLAYKRGELSAQDEARVREQLVLYPELARAVAQSSPFDDPSAGEDDDLPEEELAMHWRSLQKRIHGGRPEGGRVLQFWRISAALAAMLAVVFGTLLWQARSELGQPMDAVVWEKHELRPGGTRGGGDAFVPVTPRGNKVTLVLPLMPQPQFAGYRVELLDVSGDKPRLVDDVTGGVTEYETVEVTVRREFLEAGGRYQFVLYGVDSGREESLGTYSFRIPTE